MRPPALEKAGFFPTSTHVAELLKTYFQPAESGRLLDPCAGEGTAASILAKALHCQSWGAELSPARAALAAEKMEHLLNAPWSSCHLTSESITLLFLNPPYSHDRLGNQKRLELEFLKSSTPKLVRGGALVYIVPHRLLRDLDVAAHLAGYYEHLTVHRYPETEFKQVIVLGTKRLKFKAPSHEEIQRVQAWAEIEPPALVDKEQPPYELLPAPDKGAGGQVIRFSRLDWQPEEVVDATQKRGVLVSREWLDLLNPARALGEFKQPVMPLKKGHIAMLMASGMTGTLRLADGDGRPLLVKGRVVKVTEKVEEKAGKDGKATAEIFRDRFVSTIAILRQDGIEIIDQVEPLSKFMHKYGDQIGAHILSTYRPLYNFDPTVQETAILDTLGTSRKPLPGQEQAGLLPAQRHAATAIARSIRKNGVGNIQGEMGLGKTILGAAALELLDAYPAIVLCPPHLVPKWIREIEETIPGAKAMELSRIGRNADDPGDVNDVRQFLDLHAQGKLGSKPVAVMAHTSAKYGAGWEHAVVKKWFVDEEDGRPFQALACAECGAPIQINLPGGLTVLATSTEELGDQRRFCQAERTGYELDEHGRVQRDEDGKPVWGKRICGAPLFQFTGRRWAPADYIAKHAKKKFKMLVADECLVKDTHIETSEGPKAIQDIRVGDRVLAFNHASGQLEYRQVLHTMKNPAPDHLIRAAGIVCTPNHPIFTEKENYVEAQKILGKKVGILPGDVEISGPPQNGGLEFSRVDRVEILERGSGSGFEQVCPDGMVYNFEVEGNNNYFANGVLVHNCHQFKSKSSDRGVAFHQLVGAARCTLTLTGTFFGGKSTSIFWLLHRLNAGVRRDFAFNDEKRWARLYGVLEVTRKSKRTHDDDEEDGFTGNRRYQNQAKEQPGISPAIVNRLLDTTVFLSLKDLGLSLPHYAEEVVTLTMTHDLAGQYRAMEKKLRDLALNNRRYLSTWLQWTLARPNSAFRDEVVEVDELDPQGEFLRRQRLMDLPAVVTAETLPKESWLVDFCRSERQQGRKVLIYLRQTGTRDIQDRILHILRDGGVRAEVLTSGVNPRKREEWIARRILGLDALVVNPKLVETGLDLVAFSSVVFAEIEYSLYTLWQAVRRVWRLGQTKPVKAIFSVYSDAMEARALALMGQKMKAAQLLYGDEVGGAIVPEGDDDILMKLAREALESADLPDLQSLFADEVMVSNSPLGCPTAPSALLPVPEIPRTISWADWMKQKDLAAGRAASRPRSKPGAQNQISLF